MKAGVTLNLTRGILKQTGQIGTVLRVCIELSAKFLNHTTPLLHVERQVYPSDPPYTGSSIPDFSTHTPPAAGQPTLRSTACSAAVISRDPSFNIKIVFFVLPQLGSKIAHLLTEGIFFSRVLRSSGFLKSVETEIFELHRIGPQPEHAAAGGPTKDSATSSSE